MSAEVVAERAKHIARVRKMQIGFGAAMLPPKISGLHLELSPSLKEQSHRGSFGFWQKYMSSLKYHNPDIPMIVHQTADELPTAPSTLSIYIREARVTEGEQAAREAAAANGEGKDDPKATSSPSKGLVKAAAASKSNTPNIENISSGTPAPAARPDEEVVQLSAKNKSPADLWTEFVRATGAKLYELSEEDMKFLRDEELRVQKWEREKLLEVKRKDIEARRKAWLDAAIAEAAAMKQV